MSTYSASVSEPGALAGHGRLHTGEDRLQLAVPEDSREPFARQHWGVAAGFAVAALAVDLPQPARPGRPAPPSRRRPRLTRCCWAATVTQVPRTVAQAGQSATAKAAERTQGTERGIRRFLRVARIFPSHRRAVNLGSPRWTGTRPPGARGAQPTCQNGGRVMRVARRILFHSNRPGPAGRLCRAARPRPAPRPPRPGLIERTLRDDGVRAAPHGVDRRRTRGARGVRRDLRRVRSPRSADERVERGQRRHAPQRRRRPLARAR